MRKIVITGASGFVGKNLSNYLGRNGFEVSTLPLRNDRWQKLLNNEGEAIIHLAGKAHHTSNTTDEQEYFDVNTELTKLLFNEFLKSDIRDFFFFSSVKATADTIDTVLDEQHSSNPKTPYGKSKLLAEEYLLSQVLPEGKRLFIIRPCMIHGPGNKGNLNLLYKIVQKGVPWPLAAFENQRSFLSIDNACFLIEQMLKDKTIPSGIYNFADDGPVSTNELIAIISGTLNKTSKLLKISPNIIKYLAKLGDVLRLPLNTERLKKLTESYVVSNQKIKTALNLNQLPLSATEGLKKTIKSFKNIP